jgi:hypothetical protein
MAPIRRRIRTETHKAKGTAIKARNMGSYIESLFGFACRCGRVLANAGLLFELSRLSAAVSCLTGKLNSRSE